MNIGLETALRGGDDGVFAGGEAEEGGWLYVARAEMVLARPDHRQLAAAALDPDPLQLMASACAHADAEQGEEVALVVDLVPVSGPRVARWRRRLLRRAQQRGPSAFGEQLGGAGGGGLGDRWWSAVAGGLTGGGTGNRPRFGRVSRSSDLVAGVRKFLPAADATVFAVQVLLRAVAPHPAQAEGLLHRVMAVMDAWSGEDWWRPRGPRFGAWHPYGDVWWLRRSFDRRFETGEFAPSRQQWVAGRKIAALLKPPSVHSALGTKKIARLTAKDVRTFLDRLRTTCQCCTQGLDTERKKCCAVSECCQKRLSALTVTYMHSVLKSALEHAVREDELPRNVARNVKTPAQALPSARCGRGPQVPRRGTRRPAPRIVRTRPPHRPPQRRTPRPPLGRPRLHHRNGQHPPLTPAHPHRRPHPPAHQDSRIRTPHRPPHRSLRSLKKHQERQDKERETAGSAWTDSGLVFTTPTGRPLDQANLTRRFRSFLNRAGLRRIRFHDLRHSTATLLLEQGVDLVVIKELLGNALGPTEEDPEDPPAMAAVR